MKLIKLQQDHFIIVDENIQPIEGYYYDNFIKDIRETGGAEYGETKHCWQITHSTDINWNDVYYIPLSEVKELIGEDVDVEKRAEKFIGCKYDDIEDNIDQIGYDSFIRGYNQAIEDNKEKKYTEEDMKYMFECGRNYQNNAEVTFKVAMEYLQPKTEWEVEFVDGKFKLK